MELKTSPREGKTKKEINEIRLKGDIPAVIYSKGEAGEQITVEGAAFRGLLRNIRSGHLPVEVITLVSEDGTKRKAVVKEIQYHVTRYDVIHLDFEELHDDVKVNVKVPIEYKGLADCVGIKLGGVLRRVIRHVKVNCFPADIPEQFELDITPLQLKESRKLKDIEFPEKVRPIADLNQVAAVIVKR